MSNLLRIISFTFVFSFIQTSRADIVTLSSDDLQKSFKKVTGIELPKIKKDKDSLSLSLFAGYIYDSENFPKKRLMEEYKSNIDLFVDTNAVLPNAMIKFINKKDLSNMELLIAVRLSRFINAQIASSL